MKDKDKNEEAKKSDETKEDTHDKKDIVETNKDDDDKKTEIKKNEHFPTARYNLEFAYAPQIFSDENPNACSVM